MAENRTRVLVVCEHELMVLGLRTVLAGETDLEFVGSVRTAADALTRVSASGAAVVVVDAGFADGHGIDLCGSVRAADPGTRCVLFSACADEQLVLTAVKAGASGFLLMSSPAAGVPAAIRAVAAGESHIDPGVTRMLFEHLRQPAEPDPMAFLSRTDPKTRHQSL